MRNLYAARVDVADEKGVNLRKKNIFHFVSQRFVNNFYSLFRAEGVEMYDVI